MISYSYPGSQQELYAICTAGWQSCSENLNVFNLYKGRYTSAYITARIDDISRARLIPGNQRRGEVSESLRIQLREHVRRCLDLWQTLKRYISAAWPKKFHKAKLEAAGSLVYEKALRENWQACQELMSEGAAFITANTAALQAEDNMPAAFETIFSEAWKTFDSLRAQLIASEEQAQTQRILKVEANNRLHADLMAMFLDGQEIFRHQPELRKNFVFDHVAGIVSGSNAAGIRGQVTNGIIPVAGAMVSITGREPVTTDEDGYFRYVLPAGIYDVRFTAPGYGAQTITGFTVNTGSMSTLDVVLAME